VLVTAILCVVEHMAILLCRRRLLLVLLVAVRGARRRSAAHMVIVVARAVAIPRARLVRGHIAKGEREV